MSHYSSPMRSPLLTVILLVLGAYFGISISQALSQGYIHHQQLVTLEQQMNQRRSQEADLKRELAQKQSPNFVEEEARNKLGLAKPNETVVIFPLQAQTLGVATDSAHQTPGTSGEQGRLPASIQAWRQIFW